MELHQRLITRRVIVGLALVGACKREPDGAAAQAEAEAEAAKPQDRKARCEAIAAETTRMGLAMAKGIALGLSGGKADVDEADETKLRAELEVAEQELVRQCLEWPQEAVDCFGISGALSGGKCERIVAAAMGDPVLPETVPDGPAVAWRFTLPYDLWLLHGRDDGGVIAVVVPESPPDGAPRAFALGLRDGKQTWQQPLSFVPFVIEPLGADAVVVAGDHDVAAFAASDGSKRWSVPTPDVDDDEKVALVSYAKSGERTVFLGADRRLFELKAERCAKGPCLASVATFDLEEATGSRWLEAGVDGSWLVVDEHEGAAHVLDAKGKRRATIRAHTSVGWAMQNGKALRVGIDGAIVELDLAACGGEPFAPVAWPPAGKPEWVGDATVREIEAGPAPAACVRWSTPLGAAEGSERVATRDGSLVVQSGGFLFGIGDDGAIRFKTPVNAASLVVERANDFASVGNLDLEDVQLVVSWVDRAGKHARRTSLPLAAGQSMSLADVELVGAGPVLIAGREQGLVAFVD